MKSLSVFMHAELPTWREIKYVFDKLEEFGDDLLTDDIRSGVNDPYWKIPYAAMLRALICNQLNKLSIDSSSNIIYNLSDASELKIYSPSHPNHGFIHDITDKTYQIERIDISSLDVNSTFFPILSSDGNHIDSLIGLKSLMPGVVKYFNV